MIVVLPIEINWSSSRRKTNDANAVHFSSFFFSFLFFKRVSVQQIALAIRNIFSNNKCLCNGEITVCCCCCLLSLKSRDVVLTRQGNKLWQLNTREEIHLDFFPRKYSCAQWKSEWSMKEKTGHYNNSTHKENSYENKKRYPMIFHPMMLINWFFI